MKVIVGVIFYSFLMVACLSCTRTMSKDQLQQYILDESNGLRFMAQSGDMRIDLMYRPKELLNLEPDDMKEEDQAYLDSLDYFILKLSRQGQEVEIYYASSGDRYTEVINYLSRGIGKDIYLKAENIKIGVEDLAYTQSFGSSNGSSILIVFKSAIAKTPGDIHFVFDDSMLGTGRHEFIIKSKNVRKIPEME